MTEPTPSSSDSSSAPLAPLAPLAASTAVAPAVTLAVRFAHLVSRVVAEPGAAAEHRAELRAFLRAMKGHTVVLTALDDGVLLANGEACTTTVPESEAACVLLAARFAAYGVEMLTIGEKSAEADLNDLARLLATAPAQSDPVSFFAARASAIDVRGIPRVLRARLSDAIAVVPAVPAALPPRTSAKTPTPASVAVPAAAAVPSPADQAEDEGRADRLTEALAIPEPTDPVLAQLFARIGETTALEPLRPLLAELAEYADLAFRSGRHVAMLDAIGGLVAIEYAQLERDPSDARRAEFAQPLRRLASPVILRQLAMLRHLHGADPVLTWRVQSVLYRFGTDGVEALMDEYANVPTAAARAIILEALRALRRTSDVLHEWVRDTDDTVVREAVAILGDLGGDHALRLLADTLRHPEPRVRRATVAALSNARQPGTVDLLGIALGDESPVVRARAVAALASRGPEALGRLLPLLEMERDKEVLYTAMHAIGAIGTPEGVQALITCAQGESNGRKRSAAFRLQACAALVTVRTPQAMAAVGMLREDRDREVREGALRLVAQAARRTTSSIPIVR